MATKDDSGGLQDRRSNRELKETGVGGKRAPRSAKKQLANTRELKRREAVYKGQTTDSNN
jgi:hypothetical protein